MSRFSASSGQSIGVSASASVLPMNIHSNEYSGLISFRVDRLDLLARKKGWCDEVFYQCWGQGRI